MFIDGKWTNAYNQETFASYNPANAELLGEVPAGGKDDALAAIDSASKAFPCWSSLTAYQRSEFLIDAHRLMMESQQEIAEIMTQEQGKPIRAAMNEVQYAADFLIWFAEEAKRVYGRTIPSSRSDQRFLVLHQPVGVVCAITPLELSCFHDHPKSCTGPGCRMHDCGQTCRSDTFMCKSRLSDF